MTWRAPRALAIAAALSLALTACSPGGASEPSTALTEAPSASQGHSVGDVVDANEASELGTFSTSKNGAYAMPDGTFIVVHADDALPEAVRADMERRVALLTPVLDMEDVDGAQASFDEFTRLVALLSEESKKSVVIFAMAVNPVLGYPRWMHYGGSESERVAPAPSLAGNNESLESYVAEVFKDTRESYFEVFYALGGEA